MAVQKHFNRCSWCLGDPLYETYHDTEWGVPLFNDNKLFEFLILETFQSGLSWLTILKKRDHFRAAFDGFNFEKVAQYDANKEAKLQQNAGIIRNRLKIKATIANAQAFLNIRETKGSFSDYIWQFTDGKQLQNSYKTSDEIPAKTALSETISKELKARGFKFVGPTVVYAHMQATGMVNDHVTDCFRYQEVQKPKLER